MLQRHQTRGQTEKETVAAYPRVLERIRCRETQQALGARQLEGRSKVSARGHSFACACVDFDDSSSRNVVHPSQIQFPELKITMRRGIATERELIDNPFEQQFSWKQHTERGG